jgi:hypothetical protein
VVKDPGARGLAPPKALEVTLRNGLNAGTIWLEGRLSPVPGVIDIELRDEAGERLEESCRTYFAASQTYDYLMLMPGDAITRVMVLTCYRIPTHALISAIVHYKNEETTCPPSPLEHIPLYRGPLTSNRVEFRLYDD